MLINCVNIKLTINLGALIYAKYFITNFAMKKIFFQFILLMVVISACEDSEKKQFEHAGGALVLAVNNEPTTLIAREVSDLYSSIVISQVLEGLVMLNPKTLKPEPSIASSWKISEDGLSYTFKIRDDVYFHDNPITGPNRKLTPEDVKYSIELACLKQMGKDPSNAYNSLYKGSLLGAKAFHDGESDHIEGVSIDDKTVTLTLLKKDNNFLDKLASITTAVVLEEAVENDQEALLVGTGPFVFDRYMDNKGNLKIILLKNNNYYLQDNKGNQLPYLDSVVFIVESKSLNQLDLFENGVTHLIDGLPPSRITSMLEASMDNFNVTPPRLLLRRKPLLATQYYHFNLMNETFKDVKVRQAINYAVDKEDIVRNIINNQAYSVGSAGIVPPAAFPGYDFKGVKKYGYAYDPEKAKKLLAEAGYPNGKGFPSIDLKFNIGSTHSAVADRFAKQMKENLNINVNIDGLSFEDRIRDQMYGKGDLFRTTWFADYYSPETFLLNAYGGTVPDAPEEPSIVNNARYVNPEFDRLFEKAQESEDIKERYKYFAEAEKIMMQDAPFIILWYEETIKIARSEVRNLHLNEMNLYSFRDVYFKEWTEEEYKALSKEE